MKTLYPLQLLRGDFSNKIAFPLLLFMHVFMVCTRTPHLIHQEARLPAVEEEGENYWPLKHSSTGFLYAPKCHLRVAG